MFSAIKSAYYSKTIKKVDEQEKALEPSPHASAAVEPSAKQGTSDSNPTTLVGDGSSLVTSIENIPGSFPSDEEESMVEKGEKFWSSQLEKEISKKIMAEKDTIQARSTQSWFPEVSTKGYREADMPDVAKSSPVFAQVGNYGPPTENKTQKGTGGKNAQKNLNPAVPVKLFPLVSNTDHHGNTTISPSAPFQFCNQGPGVNSTAPWPVKPLPWFSRGLFESNAPDPVISSAISTQTDIHGPMENKAQSGPIFAKPAFPWYPETSNTSNDQISGSNRSGLSSKPTQGVREEPETTPSPFPLLKTTGPVILPAWLPHPILSNSTNQGPPADSSSQPLKSPPVKSTAAPLFVSSSFSFDLSRHSRASVTPQPHTDTTPATSIFKSSTMAPPFTSPISSSSFPPRTLFMPEPLSSRGQDKVLECNSGGIFPKSAIPTLANSGAESSRPSYKQKALHEFRPRDLCHPYAENMRTSAETPRPPVEAILPSAEKQILPTAVEAILPSAEKQIFPTNTRYQPSAKEIRSPGADAQHGNVKHWNQPEKLASSERPVTASVDPHKASTEPINKKVSAMAARWMKMTEQEVCVDLMELISSRVSLMQYQSLVSIIAELYSQPHISLDLFEVKVHDIMKRILHWFSRELKLNVAMSNRFLPTGFHFTSFLYWENKTLQIILSVSCIESISYVEVLILGDLGHGPNNLFLIGEYTLKERGPVPVSTKQQTLMGERSILRTACGLFGACKNPECKTVLGRVTSQLGKMKYNEGSPPDSVDIELFCENSILLQKARDAGEENTGAPKRLRKREDPAWKAFVRRRRNYENAILDGVDEGPTTAESVKAVEIRGDTEDPESPYSSSPDDKTKELLEKMKEQFSLSAASARKIRKGLAAAKATQNRCEGSLSKMAGTIKKSAEPSNSNIPEKGSKLQDKFTTTVITGRRRAATVFVEGVEFIMENPRWPRSSEPMLGTEFNFTIEDAEDEDDEYEDGDEDEEVVQEKEQAQDIPGPIQKQGANKGKNKSKKKGKKGKNNWKRL